MFVLQLPEIGDDDDDTLDLGASLTNPITNAMEASMSKLMVDNKEWDDVGLSNLLTSAQTPQSRGSSRRTPPSRSRSR
mgnify:CR=1 FL=1